MMPLDGNRDATAAGLRILSLWPLRLRAELEAAMREEEIRKVNVWTARYRLATVAFPEVETPAGTLDPFFNANRPEDLDEAERLTAVIKV